MDFQHILIEGPTGSGKTVGLILPTLEDRLEKGHTIIFFDHKGHEHKKVKLLAKKTGRIDDVVEIGKPHSAYINLLAELDTIRLKELIKQNRSSDAYWSNSAANLAEDIITPLRKLHDIVKHLNQYSFFKEKNIKSLSDLKEFGITLDKKPSFQTLASITSSSEKLIQYRRILSDIPKEFKKLLDQDYLFEDEIKNKRQAFAKVCAFEESLQSASRFTLSDDASDVNNGNNGVLQILDNLIASYAKKDYVNKDEYTITELMTNNVILIIDTQSFGEDTMKLFLESILKKAVQRLRTGTESPMSVFIDEANRVLFPSIDMHSDVLREAFVELIIAIQNEEQMIYKFSPIVWDSIKSNRLCSHQRLKIL